MKGIVFAGDSQIEYLDFPDPTPGPGEVVLEIKASGMCVLRRSLQKNERSLSV